MSATKSYLGYRQSRLGRKHVSENCKMDIVSQPFEHLRFKNVFTKQFAQKLKEDILALPFEATYSDLFSFKQTKNLLNFDTCRTIGSFLDTLLFFIGWELELYYKYESNVKLTVSSSLYSQGDFLLCHDDASDDRAIAFIYYLTEEPWLKEWGGSLDLFKTVDGKLTHFCKPIYPKFNSLICFKVNPNVTYHQVAEITGNVNRLTINGWFHSDHFQHEPKILPVPPLLYEGVKFYSIGAQSYLTEFINFNFFDKAVLENVRKEFTTNGMIAASDFFRSCTLEILIDQLEKCQWELQGPPYKKKYDVASIHTLPTTLRTMAHFLTSLEWVNYLESITEFNKSKIVSASFEIQRWLPGYYTLLYYMDVVDASNVVDVFIFINMSVIEDMMNIVVYSDNAPSDNPRDDDTFQLPLLHNHIFVIRRKNTSSWFIKYLQKQYTCKFYMFQMSFTFAREISSVEKRTIGNG